MSTVREQVDRAHRGLVFVQDGSHARDPEDLSNGRGNVDEEQSMSIPTRAVPSLQEGMKTRRVQERYVAKIQHDGGGRLLLAGPDDIIEPWNRRPIELASRRDPDRVVDVVDRYRKECVAPHGGLPIRPGHIPEGDQRPGDWGPDLASQGLGLRPVEPTSVSRMTASSDVLARLPMGSTSDYALG
jgi:hypothetical protein